MKKILALTSLIFSISSFAAIPSQGEINLGSYKVLVKDSAVIMNKDAPDESFLDFFVSITSKNYNEITTWCTSTIKDDLIGYQCKTTFFNLPTDLDRHAEEIMLVEYFVDSMNNGLPRAVVGGFIATHL